MSFIPSRIDYRKEVAGKDQIGKIAQGLKIFAIWMENYSNLIKGRFLS